jgi:Ribonuclease G/E
MIKLYAEHTPGEDRTALTRNDILTEFYIHRQGAPDGYGDLHWARVISLVPAMAGAFLALADTDAFLPDTAGAKDLTEGDHLAVRITRAAQGGKGPRVTARLTDAERGCAAPGPVRLLRRGPSPLEELRAIHPTAELHTGTLPEPLASEIEALGSPAIALPGGMTGSVTPTAALTAIDLDSAAATAERAPKLTAQFARNAASLPELARQIRLRNLSGAVLIDFSGLPARRRAALSAGLEAELAGDRVGPRLMGFTALGFAEILRPRLRPPLHEVLRGPHAAGLAALRRAQAEAASAPGRRLVLRAPPSVIGALEADPGALADAARAMTHRLVLRSDPALPGLSWIIEDERG